jgi:hypothetical protein
MQRTHDAFRQFHAAAQLSVLNSERDDNRPTRMRQCAVGVSERAKLGSNLNSKKPQISGANS